MSQQNLALGLGGGPVLVAVGLLCWWMTRAAARGHLERNGLAGIRTRATLASDQAWRTGHRAALPVMRWVGVLAVLAGAVLTVSAFLPTGWPGRPGAPHPVTATAFGLGYAGLLLGSVVAAGVAHRATRAIPASEEPSG